MEPIKIVVHYINKKILKGYTQNFFPNKPVFHVLPADADKPKELIEILMEEIKAVFFVRDFIGKKDYKEKKYYPEGVKPQGRVIEVTCKDGEVMVGTTTGYDPKRSGFFVFPADPQSNNIKIYIVSSVVVKVRYL